MTPEYRHLRDAVAKIISAAPFPSKRSYTKADAAIAVVLKEAAKVAESLYEKGHIGPDIAAAILALIPTGSLSSYSDPQHEAEQENRA